MTSSTPRAAAAIASLPITYTAAHRTRVLAISGSEGWPERAASELGANPEAVVVVERPVRSVSDALDGLESRVLLDSAWAHNPVTSDSAQLLQTSGDRLVTAHIDAPATDDLRQWVFEGLVLLDRVVGVASLQILDETSERFVAIGSSATGCPISVTASGTDATHAAVHVRSVGTTQAVTLDIHDPDTAAPPVLSIDSNGELHLPPTAWETSSRAVWRQAAAIADGRNSAPASDLDRFRTQLRHLPLS